MMTSRLDFKTYYAKIRKIYLVLFYNSSFAVNIDRNLSAILPFFIYLALHQQLTWAIFAKTILILFLTSFFYIVTYLINDPLDNMRDRKEGIYKLTAIREYGVNYHYGYFTACAIFLALSSQVFHWNVIKLFLLYFIILMLASLVHTLYFNIKPLTIVLERWLQRAFSIFLLKTVFDLQSINTFFVLFLFLFPFFIYEHYVLYLKKKKLFSYKIVAEVFVFYYCLVLIHILLNKTALQQNFIFFALEYLAIFTALKIIVKITNKIFSINFLKKFYTNIPATEYNVPFMERKERYVDVAKNWVVVGILFIYNLI